MYVVAFVNSQRKPVMNSAASPSTLDVRPLDQPAEMKAVVALYRAVFELDPTDPAISPRLLFALRRNGGSVIGAFDGDRLIGFAYGFLGKDAASGEVYHYSQTAAVAADWQGRGVGRALKLGQRAYVLDTGITRMRWSYDPMRAGNAHFNLDVLGARARWFVRNLFGVDDMGRDLGQPSDRLIVDWDLTGPPRPEPAGGRPARVPGWGEVVRDGPDLLIGIPRNWSAVAAGPADRATRLRATVSEALERALADGYVGVSCRSVPSTPVPGTSASETSASETSAPDRSVSETSVSETSVSETSVSETSVSGTPVPGTSVHGAESAGPVGRTRAAPPVDADPDSAWYLLRPDPHTDTNTDTVPGSP